MKVVPASKKISLKIVSTIVLGTVGFLGYNALIDKSTKKTPNKNDKLTTKENPLKSFVINNDRDTTLVFDSGSLIEIKKGTFLDEKKNSVHGPITLKYREFHKVSETILAGIPMDFDSAGTKYHFESAGMFEIEAEAEKTSLLINGDSPIQVKLASSDSRKTKFNQYYLKDKAGKWISKGKDIPTQIKPPIDLANGKSKEIDKIIPKILNPKRAQFDIEIPKGSFPELQEYKNLQFEVSPRNINFDSTKTNEDWYDVDITKTKYKNEYKFAFIGLNKRYEVLAYPVLDSINYEQTLEKFNEIHNKYNSKKMEIINRNLTNIKQLALYQQSTERSRNFFAGYRSFTSDSFTNFGLQDTGEEVVYRTFQVKNFGFYNSDSPNNLPYDLIVKANFVDNQGTSILPQKIFLIEKGKNKIFTYYSGDNLGFNPLENNILIIINKKHIYTVGSTAFKKINLKTKEFTFTAFSKLKKSYSTKDIDEYLN